MPLLDSKAALVALAVGFVVHMAPLSAQPTDSLPGSDLKPLLFQARNLSDSLAQRLSRISLEPSIPAEAKMVFTAFKAHPGTPVLIGQETRLALSPRSPFPLRLNLSLRTERTAAADLNRGLALTLDEACLLAELRPWSRVSLGRIYFILDRLGLLADNINDAFEGARLDLSFWRSRFDISAVASRQSSTNYPYRRFFISKDDYYAGRLCLDLKRLEMGMTWLASGIASERGWGGDVYLNLGRREMAAEYARYRPSENSWFEQSVWRQAWVAGADLFNTEHLTLFLQIADIDRDYTPMASSLLYSSGGRHLYFDQNSLGADLTASFRLGGFNDGNSDWLTRSAKPDRQYTLRPIPIAEVEWVGLWHQDRSLSSHRFIGRLAWPLGPKINILAEYCYRIQYRHQEDPAWQGHQVSLAGVIAL